MDTNKHSHSHDHAHEHKHDHEHEDCRGHCHHDHGHGHAGGAKGYLGEIASAVLMAAALIFRIDWLYFVAVLPVGVPVLADMFRAWRQGSFMNEFTLMTAAAVGAFCIGEYPEAVAVLLFYSFGEKLEHGASDDVRRRIRALLGSLPEEATVVENGKERKIKPADVATGSLIRVLPGEKVPVDGLLQGDLPIEFDTAAITGESVPRPFSPGEEISSGMIPVDRAVHLVTVRPFSESSMSRIMRMIESAQASKSPTETMLRRITRYYTPAVFILALLLVVTPWIVSLCGGPMFEWEKWFRRSLVFLVCSCPCALVVSIPLSYFCSLGAASRTGLLFKGSKYVDSMRKVDTVVFDKTGTLTTGAFRVVDIYLPSGDDASRVLLTAAALDAESSHPLAKGIVREVTDKGLPIPEAGEVATVPHGITGMVGGKKAAAGSPFLMEKMGISMPSDRSVRGSEICVALDGKYIGSIYLADTVKEDAGEAVSRLHALGVKRVVILSGDGEEAVSRVARQIGADGFHASLLPADKQSAVERYRESGRVVFVGDGINDAPAIAAADVGVAMGTMGTDIAMQSADVVIAGDDLMKLPEAILLARRVRRTVAENVTFALGVKGIVMGLGAIGVASLWAAVFADTGVTLITILWTLLMLRR